MENAISIQKEIKALADDVEGLRRKLENETSSAAKPREAYDFESRRVPSDDVKLVAARLRLDTVNARVDAIKAEITENECLLDEIQGREAEESRMGQAEEDFERASEKLAESQGELQRLRAEYSALPNRIREAEWRFHEALRKFNEAKQKSVAQR